MIDLHTSAGCLRFELFTDRGCRESRRIARKFQLMTLNNEICRYAIRRLIPSFGVFIERENNYVAYEKFNVAENIISQTPFSYCTDYGIVTDSDMISECNAEDLHKSDTFGHVGAGLLTYIPMELLQPDEDFCLDTLAGLFVMTLSPQPNLDNQAIIIGRLITGMSIVAKLCR